MKKYILSLVFVLVGAIAFANHGKENVFNPKMKTEIISYKNSKDYTFSINEKKLTKEELINLEDCTLKGKFTITFPDGEKFSWEGTLTIVGQSCVDFLKKMMKK
ncbi:hypothetical protein [Polaribacter porphyrae]|uniref:Uncharacterized protein n=1 Tax=Polaribacter porphyrae TaxID=1137780 RepID=A0A2S7WPG2_9FLAO|nr:hypothetical protein [Polaribacter porphyrae]PQJ79473.1 hypothetical protein BTO18_09950 [Polaribacter porphyrae]